MEWWGKKTASGIRRKQRSWGHNLHASFSRRLSLDGHVASVSHYHLDGVSNPQEPLPTESLNTSLLPAPCRRDWSGEKGGRG